LAKTWFASASPLIFGPKKKNAWRAIGSTCGHQALIRVANSAARDASNSAFRSENAARVSDYIAAAALVVAVIALVISILK
jgi:hypothetical protein